MTAVGSDTRWRAAAESFIALSEDWGDSRIDRAAVRRILQCDEEVLDLLCAHGLPVRDEHGQQSFGQCDVMNVGLATGSGRTVPELAQRQMLRFAARPPAEWTQRRAWTVVLSLDCSCAQEAGAAAWSLAKPIPELYSGATDAFSWQRDAPAKLTTSFQLRTEGAHATHSEPLVGRAMRDVQGEFTAGRLRFQYLPSALRARPLQAVRLGVVDCMALSLHLAERLHAIGLPTRTRHGHLLSGVGVEHAWLELDDPDRHVVLDPMLAVLSWGVSAIHPDFEEFCLGSVSNRVLAWDRPAEQALFAHAGEGDGHSVTVRLSARAQST